MRRKGREGKGREGKGREGRKEEVEKGTFSPGNKKNKFTPSSLSLSLSVFCKSHCPLFYI